MNGREDKNENNLFFLCSLIEYLGRITKNKRGQIIAFLGDDEINRLYDLADIYHCEPLENLASKLVKKFNIPFGDFDNIADCKYTVPTHFDIGKVYKRLIAGVANKENIDVLSAFKEVYSSPFALKLDNYNSSLFFENPDYVFVSYLSGEAKKD